MPRHISYLLLAVMLVLGVSACSRGGLRRNPPGPTSESAPVVIAPTPTAPGTASTSALPAAANSAAEVESLLQDLEHLLGSSTSDVSVP